jgi:hypothetical protein
LTAVFWVSSAIFSAVRPIENWLLAESSATTSALRLTVSAASGEECGHASDAGGSGFDPHLGLIDSLKSDSLKSDSLKRAGGEIHLA